MKRNRNIFDYILVFSFVAGICLPSFFMHHRKVSTVEKRRLAEFPSAVIWRDGFSAFPSLFEKYFNDHFGFRDPLVYVYNRLNFELGASPNPRVIVGKDGWLFFAGDRSVEDYRRSQMFTAQELDRWRTHLEIKYHALQARGIDYVFVVAPSKASVYGEYMPNRFVPCENPSRYDQLVAHMRASVVPVLDLRPALFAEKGRRPLYWKTDTHWNHRGASTAQYAIGRHIHRLYPDVQPFPYKPADFSWSVSEKSGDLAQLIKLQEQLKESLPEPRQGLPQYAVRLLDPARYGIEPEVNLFMTMLPQAPDRQALIFRDSFFTGLQPYISRYFRTATYVWASAGFVRLEEMIRKTPCHLVIEERAERFLKRVPEDVPQILSTFYTPGIERCFGRKRQVLNLPSAVTPHPFTALHQVQITRQDPGYQIVSTGKDPYFHLPPFSISRNCHYILGIDLSVPENTRGLVYYRTTAEDFYSEKKTVNLPLQKGGNGFAIILDGRTLKGQVRIDPGTVPGTYRLHRLTLTEIGKTP